METTEYISEIVYKNNVLTYIIHPEGRAAFTAGALSYYKYNHDDHLDNTTNHYLYNGKALQSKNVNKNLHSYFC